MIGEVDKAAFDFPWTMIHAGVGVAAGAVGLNPWIYGVAAVLYEVIENGKDERFRRGVFGTSAPESELNAVADIGVGLLGYVFGSWLRSRGGA